MAKPKAEVEVEVLRQGDAAVQVTDGDVKAWVPYSLIDDDSEINADSDEGDEGTLIIPQWKAEELNLV